MKTGLACWGLRETPLARQLELAVRLKVAWLELGIGSCRTDLLQPEAGAAQIDAVRKLFAAAGMEPYCAATGNDFDGPGAAASLEATLKVIEIAARLGIRALRIFGGFLPLAQLSAADRAVELDCLRQSVLAARRHGISPALETHGAVEAFADGVRFLPSSSTDPELVAETLAALPGLDLNFDPANLLAVGIDPLAFFARFRRRIAYVHLKDFITLPSGALVGSACGDGALPWPQLKQALADFSGPVLIEYENPADVENGMCRSLEFWHRCN